MDETSSGGSSSAWSFPWGAGTEEKQEPEESFTKPKSAEEIKSEVLKAAKERSKAKAKLFPEKTDKESKLKTPGGEKTEADTGSTTHLKGEDATLKGEDKESQLKERIEAPLKQGSEPRTHSSTENDSIRKDTDIPKMSDKVTEPLQSEANKDVESECSSMLKEEIVDSFREIVQEGESAQLFDDGKIQTLGNSMQIVVSSDSFTDVTLSVIEKEAGSSAVTEEEADSTEKIEVKSEVHNLQHGDIEDVENLTPDSYSKEKIHAEDFDSVKDTSIISPVENVAQVQISSQSEFSADDLVEYSGSDPEIVECEKVSSDEDIVKVSQPEICEISCKETQASGVSVVESTFDDLNNEVLDTDEQKESVKDLKPENLDSVDITEDVAECVISDKEQEHAETETVKELITSDSESSMSRLDTSAETCASEETVVEQCSNKEVKDSCGEMSLDGDEIEKELVPFSAMEKSSEINFEVSDVDNGDDNRKLSEEESAFVEGKGDISPAHSFVKCMMEDVLDENKNDDSSECHSTEKSDGSRSVNSNHESGDDEIDTTTSSDIEIISLPTPNGENRLVGLNSYLIFRKLNLQTYETILYMAFHYVFFKVFVQVRVNFITTF